MQTYHKELKKKKRKLKPFVKIIFFLIFLGIIFIILYKIKFFSSTKIFIKKSYSDIQNLTQTDDSFLSVFKKRLPSQNIIFASSTLMSNGDLKIFLKNTKDDAGYIFVNTKDDVEEVWSTFASVLIADPLKNLFINNLIDLNYIDLRFQNKVFYKFNGLNNSAPVSVSISASTTATTTSSSTNTN